jgi:hypothetical protein
LQSLLIDEGLFDAVATALDAVGLDAHAVGQPGAPPRQSTDETNCKWCVDHSAVLVTNDLGKKNPEILSLLASHRVHAIFVRNDLRHGPPHILAKALLIAESKIDEIVNGGKLLHHRLRVNGGLENLYKQH